MHTYTVNLSRQQQQQQWQKQIDIICDVAAFHPPSAQLVHLCIFSKENTLWAEAWVCNEWFAREAHRARVTIVASILSLSLSLPWSSLSFGACFNLSHHVRPQYLRAAKPTAYARILAKWSVLRLRWLRCLWGQWHGLAASSGNSWQTWQICASLLSSPSLSLWVCLRV